MLRSLRALLLFWTIFASYGLACAVRNKHPLVTERAALRRVGEAKP